MLCYACRLLGACLERLGSSSHEWTENGLMVDTLRVALLLLADPAVGAGEYYMGRIGTCCC